jgi:HEPN domain-containing protein
MNKEEKITYWLTIAENDLIASEHLFEKGDYSWCLFMGHIIIEKILKAYYTRDVNEIPPKTHDLIYLASKIKLELSEDKLLLLNKLNDFNLEARYPDYKMRFYKLCTKEYTESNFLKIKELYEWLRSRI